MVDYKLGISGLDDVVGLVKGGSNIMLIGPPMSRKEVIINNILHYGLSIGECAIFISTGESGEDALRWYEENGNDYQSFMNRFGVIDCVSKTLGLNVEDTENIKRISSPVNLTGISVSITNYFEDFWMKKGIQKARLAIDSLSTILMYSNLQTVFRFLHVHTRRIKSAGAIGIYIIESGMHDDQTIATLKQLFDGIIEIEEENESYFMRGVGLTPKPTKWFEYETDGIKITAKYKETK
ncbi:MAG: ATPase domain-containing protein [Halobacteriota archaeon]|nr:ATPase domain-containing protein [Halobacteriota archaeon]